MDGGFVFTPSAAFVVRCALMLMLGQMERDARRRRIAAADREDHARTMAEIARLIRDMEAAGVPAPADLGPVGVRH